MLDYIKQPQFGQYGESQKLIDLVTEFSDKLDRDNEVVKKSNDRLEKSNKMFSSIMDAQEDEEIQKLEMADEIAKQLGEKDGSLIFQKRQEVKHLKTEKKQDKAMSDLIAYIKNITKETDELRARVRSSEAVISDLKSSGDLSVEQIMEEMYLMKVRQADLDQELTVRR